MCFRVGLSRFGTPLFANQILLQMNEKRFKSNKIFFMSNWSRSHIIISSTLLSQDDEREETKQFSRDKSWKFKKAQTFYNHFSANWRAQKPKIRFCLRQEDSGNSLMGDPFAIEQYFVNQMSKIDQWLEDAWACRPITQSSVRALCNMVKNVLIDESNIVVVDAPVKIAGDVHGQFFDVKELFKQGGGIPDNKFIMIGDFVDRGYNSVETITLLFCLKVKYPDRIFLLRGNHECRNITMMYGFLDEINRKYGNSNCWKYFYQTFDFLPLGAVVNGKILCVHGGMSPDLPTIDQMRLLDRKQEIPHEGPLADLMWSDPDNIESWRRNTRGAGWIFGHKVVEQFNQLNGVELIVRAHQLVQEGYYYWFDEKLVTVWSAPNYCYRMNNKASLLSLDEHLKRDFIIFETVPESSTSKNYKTQMPYFL